MQIGEENTQMVTKIFTGLFVLLAVTFAYCGDEYKFFVDYKTLSDSDKADILDIVLYQESGRILTSPTTNYLYMEVQRNDDNKDKMDSLERDGKLKAHKIQKLKSQDGKTVVEDEEKNQYPDDYFKVIISSN